jgi:hypothetical protein
MFAPKPTPQISPLRYAPTTCRCRRDEKTCHGAGFPVSRRRSVEISQPFRAGLTFRGRPSGPCTYGRSLPCHFSLNLTQASQPLLMTKRRVGVSSGNWFEGSQVSKARPWAPFDFTLRYCRGHMLVISLPTRLRESAAPTARRGGRGDKGKGDDAIKGGCLRSARIRLPLVEVRVRTGLIDLS